MIKLEFATMNQLNEFVEQSLEERIQAVRSEYANQIIQLHKENADKFEEICSLTEEVNKLKDNNYPNRIRNLEAENDSLTFILRMFFGNVSKKKVRMILSEYFRTQVNPEDELAEDIVYNTIIRFIMKINLVSHNEAKKYFDP